MYTPETSKHFELFVDPVSGVKSYVLSTKVALQQQSFYFVNRAMDDAGRYLWFYCSNPPAMYRTLGVVDFETDEVRCFPETEFIGGPLVDTDTGDAIYGAHQGIYKKSPKAGEPPLRLCPIPEELKKYGPPSRIATHITATPDKSELFLDARSGDHFILGTLSLKNGRFRVWREYDYCRNHAQLNPANGDLVLYAEDHWTDNATNTRNVIRYNDKGEFMRLWTMTRDGAETMYPPLNGERATHEWWSRDGKILYYCKYTRGEGNNGITGINLETGEHKVYAPVRAWHGFSSLHDDFFVYDENDVFYRGTPSRVGFYNAATGRQVYIVTQNPALAPRENPSPYHLDPHPQLVCDDRYMSFTIAQKGYTEVALTPVDQLLEATK